MTDDLATWLRAQLDHHADVHRKLVQSEGEDLSGEREADPDGFWAIYDAHTAILDRVEAALRQPDSAWDVGNSVLHALALAYRHRSGYREEWKL